MKKTYLLFFSLLLFAVFSLTSQSAGKIDKILETENLSKGQACYLLGSFSGELDDTVSFEEAFNHYKDLKMFKDDSAEQDIRVDEFSDLILRNIELKKSFWYMITKSPYYALRHLKRMKIVDSKKDAASSIKSTDALNILSNLSELPKTKKKEKDSDAGSKKGVKNEKK